MIPGQQRNFMPPRPGRFSLGSIPDPILSQEVESPSSGGLTQADLSSLDKEMSQFQQRHVQPSFLLQSLASKQGKPDIHQLHRMGLGAIGRIPGSASGSISGSKAGSVSSRSRRSSIASEDHDTTVLDEVESTGGGSTQASLQRNEEAEKLRMKLHSTEMQLKIAVSKLKHLESTQGTPTAAASETSGGGGSERGSIGESFVFGTSSVPATPRNFLRGSIENASLNDQLARAKSDLEAKQKEMDEKTSQLATLRDELAKVNGQLTATSRQFHQEKLESLKKNHDLAERNVQLAEEVKRKETDLARERSQVQQLEQTLESLREERDRLTQESEEVRARLSEAESAGVQLRASLERRVSEVASLREELGDRDSELGKLSSELRAAIAERESTRTKDEQSQGEIERLTAEVAAARREAATLQKTINERTEAHAAELSALRSDAQSRVEKQSGRHREEIARMQSEHESELTKVREDFAARDQRAQTEFAKRLAQLKSEHETQTSQLETRIAELTTSLNEQRDTTKRITNDAREAREAADRERKQLMRTHDDEIAALRAVHDNETDATAAKHAAVVSELKVQHEAELKAVREEQEMMLAEAKLVSDKQVAEAKAVAEKELSEVKSALERQMAAERASADKQLGEAKATSEKQLADVKALCEERVKALQGQFASSMHREAQQANLSAMKIAHESELNKLRALLAKEQQTSESLRAVLEAQVKRDEERQKEQADVEAERYAKFSAMLAQIAEKLTVASVRATRFRRTLSNLQCSSVDFANKTQCHFSQSTSMIDPRLRILYCDLGALCQAMEVSWTSAHDEHYSTLLILHELLSKCSVDFLNLSPIPPAEALERSKAVLRDYVDSFAALDANGIGDVSKEGCSLHMPGLVFPTFEMRGPMFCGSAKDSSVQGKGESVMDFVGTPPASPSFSPLGSPKPKNSMLKEILISSSVLTASFGLQAAKDVLRSKLGTATTSTS